MKNFIITLFLRWNNKKPQKNSTISFAVGLVQYQEEFPFYFKMVLDKINIDFESHDYLPEEKKTYQIGEEINEKIKEF